MVTNKELAEILLANAEARIALTSRKNSNYAGGGPDGNAFKNFDIIEMITNGAISREAGMLVRITDKVARLGVLMTGGEDAVGEAVEDTLSDLANYADLALVAWRDTVDRKKQHPLDGAEQTSFDFVNSFDDIDAFTAARLAGMQNDNALNQFAESLDKSFKAAHTTPESPSSILSRFLNLGRAGKSAT